MKEPIKGSKDDGIFFSTDAVLPEMTLADALEMLLEEFGWTETLDTLAALAVAQKPMLRGERQTMVWLLLEHDLRQEKAARMKNNGTNDKP